MSLNEIDEYYDKTERHYINLEAQLVKEIINTIILNNKTTIPINISSLKLFIIIISFFLMICSYFM